MEISELPVEWREKVTLDFAKMKSESPAVVDIEAEKQRFTLSAVLQPTVETRKAIFDSIKDLGEKYLGLFIQPKEGFHISIQWSNQLEGNINHLTDDISAMVLPELETDIKLVYPSRPNLFAVVIPSNPMWMSEVRAKVGNIFTQNSFETKLPESLPLMWMSLVRFTNEFNASNLEELIDSLPKKTISCHQYSLRLSKANPFLSSESSEDYLIKSL